LLGNVTRWKTVLYSTRKLCPISQKWVRCTEAEVNHCPECFLHSYRLSATDVERFHWMHEVPCSPYAATNVSNSISSPLFAAWPSSKLRVHFCLPEQTNATRKGPSRDPSDPTMFTLSPTQNWEAWHGFSIHQQIDSRVLTLDCATQARSSSSVKMNLSLSFLFQV
jgi:hypothetical protein